MSQPTNKVLAIFARNYDQEYYTKCTYLSKGQEIGKLPIDADVKVLIDVDEHYEKWYNKTNFMKNNLNLKGR